MSNQQKMLNMLRELLDEGQPKHEVNGIIANALEALAEQVRESETDLTQLGSVGNGGGVLGVGGELTCIIDPVIDPKTNILSADLIIDLTPPPSKPAQSVTHADDDDTDDGVKLPSQLLYKGISRIIKGGEK